MSGSIDPASGTLDVAGLLMRLQGNEAQTAASNADLNSALAAAKGAAGSVAGGANLEAQGQIAVNEVVQRNAIKLQTDNASAAARVGMTPGAPSDLVMATIGNLQANQQDLIDRADMINSKKSQDFFDNPLQWLTNQITLPNDIASYNLKVGEQERNLAFLGGLSKTFDDQAKVNATVDVATGQSLLDGLNKIALGKAQAAASASQMHLATLGINVANMRVDMTDKVYKNYMQASDFLGRQQQQVLLNRAHESAEKRADAAAARAEEADRRATIESDARSTERDRKESGRAALQANLDAATTLIGQGRVDVEAYLLDPNKQKWLEPFLRNINIQTPSALGGGHLGSTPAEAVNMVRGIPLTPGDELTRRFAETQINSLVSGKSTTWRSLGPEAQTELINKQLRDAAVNERNNIPVVPTATTLYAPPPLRAVLSMKSISDRFTLIEDLKPLAAADPNTATDPQLFFAAAVKRINDGSFSVDQAALEIANIYRAIGFDNSLLRGYDKFNLPILMADNGGFKQTISVPGGLPGSFGFSSVVDLMNASAVRNMLERLTVATKVQQMRDPNTPQGRAAMGIR